MPMRRKPRNEPPKVTIRWQRRQMIQMEQTIGALRLACDDKDKVIAGFDVQMSEQDDQIKSLQRRNEAQAAAVADAKKEIRDTIGRLAYLEGYFYAKEKETPHNSSFPRVSATGAPFLGDPPQTHPRSGPRDSEDVSVRRQDAESQRAFEGTAGHGRAAGGQVRGLRRDDPGDPEGRKVEHVEITEAELCPYCMTILDDKKYCHNCRKSYRQK